MNKYFKKTMVLIIFGIIFFFLFTSLLGFYTSIRPPKIISHTTPENFGLEFEKISFITDDNITLRGWFIPHKNPKSKTIILMHGYPADKGDILPSTAYLAQEYNLLLFDFRYLGASGGSYSTIGIKETKDLKAAVNWLKSRGINEVGVWGFSVGGAVALMAATDTPEIKAIISDSSYASLKLLTPDLYRLPGLRYPLGWMSGLWAKLLLNIDIYKDSPQKAGQELKLPILIIHSQSDKVIPFTHGLLLQQALSNNAKAEFWFSKDLIHGERNIQYQQKILDFFAKHL